jgi:hypothetical protein
MPEIPWLLDRGKRFATMPFVLSTKVLLYAIMHSPKDIPSIKSFVHLYHGGCDSHFVTDSTQRFLKGKLHGLIAGEIFLCLLSFKLHRPKKDTSVSKAVFLVSKELKAKRTESWIRIATDCDRIHNCWTKFRPAAHLWAAFNLLECSGQEMDPPNASAREIRSLNDDLILIGDGLLSEATAAGLNFDPDPWTVPDGFPGKPANVRSLIQPPTLWAIETLKNYRAPVRSRFDPDEVRERRRGG